MRISLAVLLGAAIGAVAGLLERTFHEHEFLEKMSLLGVTVALTVAVLGGMKLLGGDGILAAFVAGLAFNHGPDAIAALFYATVVERLVGDGTVWAAVTSSSRGRSWSTASPPRRSRSCTGGVRTSRGTRTKPRGRRWMRDEHPPVGGEDSTAVGTYVVTYSPDGRRDHTFN